MDFTENWVPNHNLIGPSIIYGQFFSITTLGHSINPREALKQEKLVGMYCNHHDGTINIKPPPGV
jgi:hypothetical protein